MEGIDRIQLVPTAEAPVAVIADVPATSPKPAMLATSKKKVLPRLLHEDRVRIKAYLMSFTCSEVWAESILDAIEKRDKRGKLLVRYQFDSRGRLKTKMADLLVMVADAKIYPPAADDVEKFDRGSGVHHIGSQMRPCYCEGCTRSNREGVARHTHWPAHYMVKDHLSYTCSVNKAILDHELQDSFPGCDLLCEIDGRAGRALMSNGDIDDTRADRDAWRKDKLRRLPWRSLVENLYALPQEAGYVYEGEHRVMVDGITKSFLDALGAHRWTQVVGDSWTGNDGREHNNVRKITKGLNNLGSITDFLELGHQLTEVGGIPATAAAAITAMVSEYPREPRLRRVRFKWQRTRLGKSRN